MDEFTDSLDAKGGLVTPGLINCHTHAPMSLFRGLGDDEPDRLQRYIFPLEAKYVSPEFVRTGTALSCVETFSYTHLTLPTICRVEMPGGEGGW